MSDSSKSKRSIPSWQQAKTATDASAPTAHPHASDPSTQSSYPELLEEAREFLQDDTVQAKTSRERKIEFLKEKGIHSDDIERLLSEQADTTSERQTEELKTVHDSTSADSGTALKTPATSPSKPDVTIASSQTQDKPSQPHQQPQRDIPPIITYPEFLLKPQKPPSLITVPRLVNAAYVFGGIATLTYAASKYIVEPMLGTLTEARHSLAATAIEDLETLNKKLELSVSHVPYIASGVARKSMDQTRDNDDDGDNDSIVSDPTELFHHDIATQTTPSLSRTQSMDDSKTHLDPTTQQVQRLSSLHDTLTSLVSALDPKEVPYLPPSPSKKLHETISDFQNVLDKLETLYNPLRTDYYSGNTINPYPAAADSHHRHLGSSSSSKTKTGKDGNHHGGGDVTAKVRQEIRALKGAFLSARNFPTPSRPPTTTTGASYNVPR